MKKALKIKGRKSRTKREKKEKVAVSEQIAVKMHRLSSSSLQRQQSTNAPRTAPNINVGVRHLAGEQLPQQHSIGPSSGEEEEEGATREGHRS